MSTDYSFTVESYPVPWAYRNTIFFKSLQNVTLRYHYNLLQNGEYKKSRDLAMTQMSGREDDTLKPYRNIMRLYTHYGYPEYGNDLFEELRRQSYRLPIVDYARIIGYNIKKGNKEYAYELLSEAEAIPSAMSRLCLYHALLPENPEPNEIMEIMDRMRAQDIEPEAHILNRLVHSYLKKDQVTDALKVILRMNQQLPGIINAFIDHCYIHNDVNKAVKFIKIFNTANIEINEHICQILLELFVKNESLSETFTLLEGHMDKITCSTFCSLAAKLQKRKKSYYTIDLFWNLSKIGFVPNIRAIRDILQALRLNEDYQGHYKKIASYLTTQLANSEGDYGKASQYHSLLLYFYAATGKINRSIHLIIEGITKGYKYDRYFLVEHLRILHDRRLAEECYLMMKLLYTRVSPSLHFVACPHRPIQTLATWFHVKHSADVSLRLVKRVVSSLKYLYRNHNFSKSFVLAFAEDLISSLTKPEGEKDPVDYLEVLIDYALLNMAVENYQKGLEIFDQVIHNTYSKRVRYQDVRLLLDILSSQARDPLQLEAISKARQTLLNLLRLEREDIRFSDIPSRKMFISPDKLSKVILFLNGFKEIYPPDPLLEVDITDEEMARLVKEIEEYEASIEAWALEFIANPQGEVPFPKAQSSEAELTMYYAPPIIPSVDPTYEEEVDIEVPKFEQVNLQFARIDASVEPKTLILPFQADSMEKEDLQELEKENTEYREQIELKLRSTESHVDETATMEIQKSKDTNEKVSASSWRKEE